MQYVCEHTCVFMVENYVKYLKYIEYVYRKKLYVRE